MKQKATTPDLNLRFADIEFKSPIGVGAIARPWGRDITPKEHAEVLLKHVAAGAGYICLPVCLYLTKETQNRLQATARFESKAASLRPRQSRMMKIQTPVAPYGVGGMYWLNSPFWHDLERAEGAFAHAREVTQIVMEKKPADVRLIANVLGMGSLPDSYVDGAREWERLGADLIELNVSCPIPTTAGNAVEDFLHKTYPPRFQGALIGDHTDIVEGITRRVAEAVKIPVGVKLTPETGFPHIVELCRRLRDSGAKWVQVINAGVSIAPPDIYNRGRPLWPFTDGNPFVSASGSWLRIQCYKDVAAIAKFVPGIDIAAAGGLVVPEHIVEVMMLGARLGQLCTGVIEQGRKLISLCDSFLKRFMMEQNYQSIEEIIALGQQYITANEDVDLMAGEVVAETDEAKCTQCGACVDNICIARYWQKGIARAKRDRCSGCGACMLACPTDAIRLVLRKDLKS